ncbi:MAG: hypothetical protein EAZ55_05000 [Cytophagales bacterium]|nr:MAG: hypothetical protein EAZ55_05000 [Cytophagales bacterium]
MNKHLLLLFTCTLLTFATATAQKVNDIFPQTTITYNALDGKEARVTLPRDGRVCLIVVSRPSGKDSPALNLLQNWQPFLNNLFMKREKEQILGGVFEDEGAYDGEIYYVALVPGAAENSVLEKIKENARPEDKEHIGVYPVGQSRLDVGKDELVIYLVHQKGTIVYKTSGEYSQQKYQGIEGKLQEIRDNTR